MGAVERGIARFSRDTKKSFLDLYTKIDATGQEIPAAQETPAMSVEVDPACRVDLDVKYEDRFEAKQIGAQWDPTAKKWYVSGKVLNESADKSTKWSPKVTDAVYTLASTY